ncbi:hypothetical protein HII31_07067 [Pseudocercospora fuligena]|uniref:G domain-containing protein n=1 Tax=Pseudocercospora fuligena TaxID=685502 RepID=A0A8H6RGS4_9PEZI|nr:hypothetical protein HII31_07067 [Pseudocercospora fuligena]
MASSDTRHDELEDVFIAVTGLTGAGKSEFISLCVGQDAGIGHGLESGQSCSSKHKLAYRRANTFYISETFDVQERTFDWNDKLRIHLIDTPGFNDTHRQDVDILREIAGYMVATYNDNVRLSGMIYLFSINHRRIGGSALRNMKMFKDLVGQDGFPGIILATTMWDTLEDKSLGEQREQELVSKQSFWGGMVERGSRVMRHTRTRESAMTILEAIITRKHPFALKIQEEMVEENLVLHDTAAGKQVNQDLLELQQKYQKELDALKRDMIEADSDAQKEISRLMQQHRLDLENIDTDRHRLEVDMANLEAERTRELESLQEKLDARERKLSEKDQKIRG